MENKRNRDENDMYDKKRGDPSATAGLGSHPDQNNLDQDGKQKKAPDSKEDEKKRKKEEERRRKEEEKEKVNYKVTKVKISARIVNWKAQERKCNLLPHC